MTLVEMLGVLAVVAVLAAVSLALTLRHLDQIASEKETQNLTILATALEKSILRNGRIPNATDWAAAIATEAGTSVSAVTTNFRNCQRVIVFDGGGWLSSHLPYTNTMQNATTITAPPTSARAMLVSTISGNLPFSSGLISSQYFSDLWNCADGTVPSAAPWATWTQTRPDDVKVHRINLGPLFVRLLLSTYFSDSPGQYAAGIGAPSSPTYYLAPYSNAVAGYYMKGTAVQLYTNQPVTGTAPQLTHVLNEDSSYVFENGFWKTGLSGGRTMGAGSSMGIVAAFLAARPNTNAEYYTPAVSNLQQVIIVTNFIAYMSNYNRWQFTNMTVQEKNDLRTYMQNTLQPNLMDRVQGLYTKIGGSGPDHFPTNGLIWPPL
jgi:type II secretory pathway pseudopilin PulG